MRLVGQSRLMVSSTAHDCSNERAVCAASARPSNIAFHPPGEAFARRELDPRVGKRRGVRSRVTRNSGQEEGDASGSIREDQWMAPPARASADKGRRPPPAWAGAGGGGTGAGTSSPGARVVSVVGVAAAATTTVVPGARDRVLVIRTGAGQSLSGERSRGRAAPDLRGSGVEGGAADRGRSQTFVTTASAKRVTRDAFAVRIALYFALGEELPGESDT